MSAANVTGDPAGPGHRLTIHAERCVHTQVTHGTCQACVSACPRQAWRHGPDGLSFDAEACDACGLCVADCPTDALELPSPAPRVTTHADGSRTLALACERAVSSGGAGVTPCLYGLSPGWLVRAAEVLSAASITLVPGDCARCPRGGAGPAWRAQWLAVAERLRAAGHPVVAITPASAETWPASDASAAVAPRPRWRRWRGDDRAAAALPPLPGQRRWLLAPMARASASAATLWSVTLDADRCTWCLACVRLCPSEALTLRPADAPGAPARFVLDMHRCTGCGLCHDACDSHALSAPRSPVAQAEATGPTQWTLARRRCSACRVEYFWPDSEPMAPAAICPTCRQGRARQHNRLVQQDCPT
ncbi:MAG TPA: 4Fe-4S dicluster domain-containing protein [Burkholderiaceae bacterium]|nr:4Fe-4S dicluster domain-containing protein [Burkholderiaceae bacterium]